MIIANTLGFIALLAGGLGCGLLGFALGLPDGPQMFPLIGAGTLVVDVVQRKLLNPQASWRNRLLKRDVGGSLFFVHAWIFGALLLALGV